MRQIRILKSGKLNYPFMGVCSNRRAVLNERDLLVDNAGISSLLTEELVKAADVINNNAEVSKHMLEGLKLAGKVFSGIGN